MKAIGTVAGVPDTIWIKEGRAYALELKVPGRQLTIAQLGTIAALQAAGACICVAEGLDRALAVLEAWGLLRGRAHLSDRRGNAGDISLPVRGSDHD